MTKLLNKAGKMAALLEIKNPGSIRMASFPKAVYEQEKLNLLYKKDQLHSFICICKTKNLNHSPEEISQFLGLELSEYEACHQALIREGRI